MSGAAVQPPKRPVSIYLFTADKASPQRENFAAPTKHHLTDTGPQAIILCVAGACTLESAFYLCKSSFGEGGLCCCGRFLAICNIA